MIPFNRYLAPQIVKDLAKKMVFVGGPRQVGKTTVAKSLLGADQKGYLNWDIEDHREALLKRQLPDCKFWVFDEIHKYRLWRNFLKGVYDKFKDEKSILVTGSARLDYYRFMGDSLQGRYHFLRMHPLSLAELKGNENTLRQLFELGGFPEPFFSGEKIEAKRWSREYRNRHIREDVATIETISDLGNLERLMLRLPELVGSPLSINALREDLQISHKTASRWLDILERMYGIVRLSPIGSPRIRAVKKEQKHYHFDWTLISSPGLRFENLVAIHLLKWTHFLEDTEARDLELRYFRDTDKREVDFVVVESGNPIILIECKLSDESPGDGLKYLKRKFPNAEAWQISYLGTKDYVNEDGIRVAPAVKFLENLV